MPYFRVYRKERKNKQGEKIQDKFYTAHIKFGTKYQFQRSTKKTNERDAEIEAKRIMKHLQEVEIPRREEKSINIDHMFGRYWDEHGKKLRTAPDAARKISKIIDVMGEFKEIRDIDDSDVNDFIQFRLKEGVSNASVNSELKYLRAALRRASRRWKYTTPDLLWEDHFLKEDKERVVFLTKEEAKEILQYLPDNIAAAYMWSLYSGARASETKMLKWTDIDFDNHICRVHTKGGGQRTIQLSRYTYDILKSCKRRKGVPYVFDLSALRYNWDKARAAIGRPEVRWHDLRHTYATWLRQLGSDSIKTQKALGHANLEMTKRYAHVGDGELKMALDQMPDITAEVQKLTQKKK